LASLIRLFSPEITATIAALPAALQSDRIEPDLVRSYDRLTPVDFSRDLLASQPDNLKVCVLLRCGWWPAEIAYAHPPPLRAAYDRDPP